MVNSVRESVSAVNSVLERKRVCVLIVYCGCRVCVCVWLCGRVYGVVRSVYVRWIDLHPGGQPDIGGLCV